MDQIDFLINQVHKIFDENSVFDMFDVPTREEAAKWLAEFYGLSLRGEGREVPVDPGSTASGDWGVNMPTEKTMHTQEGKNRDLS